MLGVSSIANLSWRKANNNGVSAFVLPSLNHADQKNVEYIFKEGYKSKHIYLMWLWIFAKLYKEFYQK